MDEENQTPAGISRITIQGFKSLAAESTIEIGNLTLLAGANSSGKSSIMQPLLLLKQTLEAIYDPGPLLLNGPNTCFTSIEQLLSKTSKNSFFSVALNVNKQETKITFQSDIEFQFNITKIEAYMGSNEPLILYPQMSIDDFLQLNPKIANKFIDKQIKSIVIKRNRCFLNVQILFVPSDKPDQKLSLYSWAYQNLLTTYIPNLIHVPGLRGNPERTYKTTGIGQDFPGTFENYVASIIHYWQINQDPKLEALGQALENLGLSWKIEAKRLDSVQVELKVGRLKHGNLSEESDLVSIADVGFGVSQTLPVIVALLTAEPGQLVYLEQPEIHLHPRAQVALAQILAAAAKRGVKVVAETHSSLLLLGVQTLIAEGELDPELVRLHWFTRGEDGTTTISSVTPDETGAFGDWPEDFADVSLKAQSRYMDAVDIWWSQKKR